MTTLYDMASGKEYLGEELSCPKPVVVRTPAAPPSGDHYQVELRLVPVEPTPSTATATASIYPVGLDLKDLIDKIPD